MKKTKYTILMIILLSFCLFACGSTKTIQTRAQGENSYQIYYLNKDETKIISEEFVPDSPDTKTLVSEMLTQLSREPVNFNLKKVLGNDTKMVDYKLEANQIILNFDDGYLNMSKTTEILFRASVVKTMTQIPKIECISFQINGNPLVDTNGKPVGNMMAESFIDNTGNEINSYEKTTVTLYFANNEGNKLVEKKEDVIYSSNISMEKLVLEKLIEGPVDKDVKPTLDPERKINSITLKDGICYVDLTGIAVDTSGYISEELSLYSIVNSLSELKNVNKVQISIDGESNRMFRENMDLSGTFERNLDLVEQ
ncbi:MAG: GerMN domain-containing protein [Lachnospiraceae bacterium]|nr:GerMN domain-containing protein [Lachnospiraceae bacterium]